MEEIPALQTPAKINYILAADDSAAFAASLWTNLPEVSFAD
jgi:hypothetical protein